MNKRTLEKMLFKKGFRSRILTRKDDKLNLVNTDNSRYFVYQVSETIKVGLFIDFQNKTYHLFSYDMQDIEMKVMDCPLNWHENPMLFYIEQSPTCSIIKDIKQHLMEEYNIPTNSL